MSRFCCCCCCFEANETIYTEQSNGHMTIATCANAELVGEYLHYRRRFCVDALYVYYAFAGINVYYVVISSNICFCMATKAALEIDSLQYIFCWLFFILSLVFSFLLVQTGSARIHNNLVCLCVFWVFAAKHPKISYWRSFCWKIWVQMQIAFPN